MRLAEKARSPWWDSAPMAANSATAANRSPRLHVSPHVKPGSLARGRRKATTEGATILTGLAGTLRRRAKRTPVPRHGSLALTLSAEIRQRFDEFSRSQKDVGQYIVDHLEEAAFHTAEELARRANTSSSTVVRFAQALGFDGFPQLQAAARDEYRRSREHGTAPE